MGLWKSAGNSGCLDGADGSGSGGRDCGGGSWR